MKQLINKIKSIIMKTHTKEWFEEINKNGFEGDENINTRISELVKKHKITTIIETGTRYGNTTKRLAAFASTVSCELDKLNYEIAKGNLINKETGKDIALVFNCDSVAFLKMNLPNLKNQRLLIYLDAHGAGGTPLLAELAAISEACITPIIIIHDFKVPNRPELGFDTYNGQPYTLDWIKSHLEFIYTNGYNVSYNGEASGAMRGVIYIEPAIEETADLSQLADKTFNEKLDEVSEKIIKSKKNVTRRKKDSN